MRQKAKKQSDEIHAFVQVVSEMMEWLGVKTEQEAFEEIAEMVELGDFRRNSVANALYTDGYAVS